MTRPHAIDARDRNALHALDALDEHDRGRAAAHLESCTICQADLREFERVIAELGASMAITPTRTLRQSVLTRISLVRQRATGWRHLDPVDTDPSSRGRLELQHRWSVGRRGVAALLATAAALALVAGFGQTMFRTATNDPDASFTEQDIAASTSPGAIILAEGPNGPNIEVNYEPSTGEGTLIATGLDPLPSDEAYALWFVDQDGLRPAGLFRPRHLDQPTELKVRGLDARTISVAITIEPSMGSDEPTGDILFMSDVA